MVNPVPMTLHLVDGLLQLRQLQVQLRLPEGDVPDPLLEARLDLCHVLLQPRSRLTDQLLRLLQDSLRLQTLGLSDLGKI